jgi:ribosomal protein S18 acetylase RimI-like enzyme
VHIQQLSAAEARDRLPELVALLQDSVNSGASVGYLPPLSDTMAQEYWQGVIDSLSGAGRLLLTANAGTTLIGTVQLVLESRPNGRHRAEVSKLLVHTTARRHGVGTALMRAVEVAAQSHGRSLLVLDTVLGDDGQRLYAALGYETAGVIPGYALRAGGPPDATVIMYKQLIAVE